MMKAEQHPDYHEEDRANSRDELKVNSRLVRTFHLALRIHFCWTICNTCPPSHLPATEVKVCGIEPAKWFAIRPI